MIIICLVMSEDLDEESSIGSPDAPKVVSRNYFPVGSPVSRDHTIKVYGERAHGKNEDQLALWQKRLEKARKSAHSWGTFQITRKMLEEATRLGIWATAVTDLHRMWKDDDSDSRWLQATAKLVGTHDLSADFFHHSAHHGSDRTVNHVVE